MPIQGKTTNIGASDINKLLGTPNQTVSLGNIANTWIGTAKSVSLGNDFTDTFVGTQFGSTVVPPNLTDDPLDWFHRGTYCSGEQMAASADGQRIAIAKSGSAVSVLVWNGSSWVPEATITKANMSYTNIAGSPPTISSIAMNSDGTTMAIGHWYYTATGSYPLSGAVIVFTRSGSTWTQQAFLTPSGFTTGTFSQSGPQAASFDSIALSADGNTLAVGGPYDNGTQNPSSVSTSEGAVYIFTRSGSTWSQQARLTSTCRYGSIVASYDQKLGSSVGLSSDGNTLVAGGPYDSASYGAVVVFTRSGSTWSQQFRLENNGTTYGAYLGNCAAMSPDGNTMCVTYVNYSSTPTSYVTVIFTRSGSVWSQQQTITEPDNQGNAANKFADNNTLILGSTAVYTRSGSTWTKVQSMLYNGVAIGKYQSYVPYCAVSSPSSFFVTTLEPAHPVTVQYSLSGSSVNQVGNTIFIKPIVLTPATSYGNVYGGLTFNKDTIYVGEVGYKPNGAVSIINNGSITAETVLPTVLGGEFAISADGNWMVTSNRFALNAAKTIYLGEVSLHANVNGTWVWQSTFSPTDTGTINSVNFGMAVAISSDGTTVAVQTQYDGNSTTNGSLVYMLTRTGSTLTQQGKFAGPGLSGYSDQPGSIAISADGNTVAAGYRNYNNSLGLVKVFSRSNGVWSLQNDFPAIRKGTNTGSLAWGSAVTLSGDGNTLAIGAPYDTLVGATTPTVGAVHIYTRSGSTWTYRTFFQSPNNQTYYGMAVSLSGDGYTLLVGAPSYGVILSYGFVLKRQSVTGDVWTSTTMSSGIPAIYGLGYGASTAKIDKKGKTVAISFATSSNGVMIFK